MSGARVARGRYEMEWEGRSGRVCRRALAAPVVAADSAGAFPEGLPLQYATLDASPAEDRALRALAAAVALRRDGTGWTHRGPGSVRSGDRVLATGLGGTDIPGTRDGVSRSHGLEAGSTRGAAQIPKFDERRASHTRDVDEMERVGGRQRERFPGGSPTPVRDAYAGRLNCRVRNGTGWTLPPWPSNHLPLACELHTRPV